MITEELDSQLLWQVNSLRGGFIPVADRGLAYGDGLFETMYFRESQCALLDWHRQRLLAGCERLDIPLAESCFDQQLLQFLASISAQSTSSYSESTPPLEGVVKLIVTRGVGGRGYSLPTQPEPQLVWQWLPFRPTNYQASQQVSKGVCLSLSEIRLAKQPLLAGLKHLNRLEYVLAAKQSSGEDIPLLLDSDDCVIEALSQNIYMTQGNTLMTPALSHCGVDGVLRQFTRQHLVPNLALKWQEGKVTWDTLLSADEVFIGNSVRGFWPVIAIKSRGVKFADKLTGAEMTRRWPIGPICRQLQQTHQQYLQSIHG